jgi:hypothetical protein
LIQMHPVHRGSPNFSRSPPQVLNPREDLLGHAVVD